MREECEICGDLLVMPAGPKDSPFLLVGAYPGWEEIRSGRPWVGNAGDVLKQELKRVGYNLKLIRVTNLWMHRQPSKKEDRYEEELDYHFKRLVQEMQGRKSILLMGALPVSLLTGHNVTDVEGTLVNGPYIPKEAEIVLAMRNPAAVLTDGAVVGNVRHSIERWGELSKEWR
jgi:DNA polymerase